MKTAWIVAFALPVLSCSLSHPQQTSSQVVPAPQTPSEAKATSGPGSQEVLAARVVSEDDVRQAMEGKQFFLRGLWLDDDLHFNMYGALASQSPKGSFTLCNVEIDHVRITKRRVELEGVRYGIHFEDEARWADQASSFDRIRVTPKKKRLIIVIDRQQVIVPKKKKGQEETAPAKAGLAAAGRPAADSPVTPEPATATREDTAETTTDPAKAAGVLRDAINRIFAPSLDPAMIAQMPEYWRYFYQAQLDHKSIEPTDPGIVRPGPGVEGPRLLKNLVAASNDYAQKSEVAGVASYKVILGTDGKPMAIAVFRPIGFGLDENAVQAIQKSTFTPAYKAGKATMSVIDVDVSFRIYSKRTAQPAPGAMQETADASQNISPVTGKPSQPGLFSAEAVLAAKQ